MSGQAQRLYYFNSQPHKEADAWIQTDEYYNDISTHSLIKRLTK